MGLSIKERAAKIREVYRKEVDKALSDMKAEDIKLKVTSLLNDGAESTLLKALGLKKEWGGGFVVEKDSPLYRKIMIAVNTTSEQITFTPVTLTPKQLGLIQREYEKMYVARLKEIAHKEAWRKAETDLEALFSDRDVVSNPGGE